MASNRRSRREAPGSFIWLPGRGRRCASQNIEFWAFRLLPPAWRRRSFTPTLFIACGIELELFYALSRLAELRYSQRPYAMAWSFAKRLVEIAKNQQKKPRKTIAS